MSQNHPKSSSSSAINNGRRYKKIVGSRQMRRRLKMQFDEFMKETELNESGCEM